MGLSMRNWRDRESQINSREHRRMAHVDMKSANSTYGRFITMLKWAVPIIALIVLFVVLLIAD